MVVNFLYSSVQPRKESGNQGRDTSVCRSPRCGSRTGRAALGAPWRRTAESVRLDHPGKLTTHDLRRRQTM